MTAGRLYAPFEAPYWMMMGLIALKWPDWFEVDDELPAWLAEKDRLLADERGQVLAALPGSEAAQAELLELMAAHLAEHHAPTHGREGDAIRVVPAARLVPLADRSTPAIERAARLVQEDLCLMQQDGAGSWVLTAACVCFPTRWNLAAKIGRPLDAIHAPVPGFADRVGPAVARFFDRLRADRPVWRLNWSIVDDPALFQPGGHGRTEPVAGVTAANAGERLWLRVERQTLARLPQTGAVLFGIRIHRHPLGALAGRPAAARRLAEAARTMPADLQRYKSLPAFADALLGWLDRVPAG